ncbi:MAG: glycosyltransferase family 4 protein [Desulfovibrionaceae bacterium]|nr:glycosyltransferase family 4 protein [Desulfovibrionaceae bacterium]MBF0513171.1 glycosyltransferase family 4 protein [Desulfovibrionaceae bacterium]
MKILLINYEYPPVGGGAGNAAAFLAKEFLAAGAAPVVLTTAFGCLPRREDDCGVPVVRIATGRRRADRCSVPEMTSFMARAVPAALALHREFSFDASLAFFGIPGGPAAYVLKRLRKTPYVVSLRGGDVPGFLPGELSGLHALTRPVIRHIWKHAASVVANSLGLAELARRTAGKTPIAVIANGVDTQRFAPGLPKNASEPARLLFAGRVVRQKGLDVLLPALAALANAPGRDFHLDVAGDGSEVAELRALAERLGIGAKVSFLGWRDRDALPGLYARADVFVFPSRDEGMPNAVLEAMASALPVVATDIAGNQELVRHEQTGLLTPCEDVPALTAALDRLIRDRELAARYGKAGRRLVQEDYSWRAAARAYLDLLGEAAAKAGYKWEQKMSSFSRSHL